MRYVASIVLLASILGFVGSIAVTFEAERVLCLGTWRVDAQRACDCIDVIPPGGRTCEERRARGECDLRWIERGNYCAETCGFCQCTEEIDDCSTCDDIPPDGAYTCQQQRGFGKCDEPWMRPFCRRTCGRCNCAEDAENFAFDSIDAPPRRVRTIAEPLTEVLPDDDDECSSNVFETLTNASQFTVLGEMAKSVGLQSTLEDANFTGTLFAPVSEAFLDFAAVSGLTLDAFVNEFPDKVLEILQYHIVPFPIGSEKELGETFSFPTLAPEKRLFGSSPIEIDGIGTSATVLQNGVKICRAVVYTIDEVLLPGTSLEEIGPVIENVPEPQEESPKCDPDRGLLTVLQQDPELSAFFQALEDAELSATLSNEDATFTVFAPTDEAFQLALAEMGMTYAQLLRDKRTLRDILNYHIVRANLESDKLMDGELESIGGEKLRVVVERGDIEIAGIGSSANVLEVDVDDVCTSAVHKIDTTLLPFDIGEELWSANRPAAARSGRDRNKNVEKSSCTSVTKLLAQSNNLRVLNSVARGAGLLPELADEQQSLTIFAPTDTAFFARFQDSETGALSPLLADPELLQSIMAYHTIKQPLTFKALRPGKKLDTEFNVDGDNLQLFVVKKRLSPTGIILRGEDGDEAAIVQKNIVACNTVIHLIDKVLLPFEVEEKPIATAPVQDIVSPRGRVREGTLT